MKIANHAVRRCRACHLMMSVKGWEGRWLLCVSGRPHDKVYSEYVAFYQCPQAGGLVSLCVVEVISTTGRWVDVAFQ